MKRKNLLRIIAAVLVISALFAFGGCAKEKGGLKENELAPDFTAKLSNGESFTLSDYKDKVVLLNFWATWCPPCVGELPAFEKLKNEGIDNFVLLTVNCAEPKSTVDAFIRDKGYTFNVAYDEDGSIEKLYPTDGIPYTLIIKNGVIEQTFLGAPRDPYTEYKNAVEKCLNK